MFFGVFVSPEDGLIVRENGRHRRAHHHLLLPVGLPPHRLRGLPLVPGAHRDVRGVRCKRDLENFRRFRKVSSEHFPKMRPKKRRQQKSFGVVGRRRFSFAPKSRNAETSQQRHQEQKMV